MVGEGGRSTPDGTVTPDGIVCVQANLPFQHDSFQENSKTYVLIYIKSKSIKDRKKEMEGRRKPDLFLRRLHWRLGCVLPTS